MKTLAKYFHTFKISWQQQLEYRLNTFIRFLITLISLVSIFYLWNNIYRTQAVVLGYSKEQMVTYYIIVGFIFSSIYASIPIREEIKDGTLSAYITKPINYLWYQYWQSLARRVIRMCIGLPILIFLFFTFRKNLYIVTDPKAYLVLFITSLQAINIVFLVDVILNAVEFWMFFSESINIISDTVIGFFAGTLIPVFFLPNYIQQIGRFLPFKYIGFFIIDAFLGRIDTFQIIQGMGMQTLWTILLLIIAKIVWKNGLKKYEATGG